MREREGNFGNAWENKEVSSYTLELPNNEKLQKQLEAKLAEYLGRDRKLGFYPGSLNRYKIIILQKLLGDHRVEPEDMRALYDHEDNFDDQQLLSAFRIIRDYLYTGGTNLVRGTGLKDI